MQKRKRGQKVSTTNIDKEIGLFIKHKRERKKSLTNGAWHQEDVAKLLGVTVQQYQKYEKGTNKISLSTFIKLVNLLEFTDKDKLGIFEITE